MTTPKCVLGFLSSGALGGAEMTGGLEGFLLEVVVFSEGGGKKNENKAKQVFRDTGSTKSTHSSEGRWSGNLKFPTGFRNCFIRGGSGYPAVSYVVDWMNVDVRSHM